MTGWAVTPDRGPGREVDGWTELKWAIAELQHLAARLTVHLDADDEHQAITWDQHAFNAGALLERTLRDVGELSAAYLRCSIADRRGIDPLGLNALRRRVPLRLPACMGRPRALTGQGCPTGAAWAHRSAVPPGRVA